MTAAQLLLGDCLALLPSLPDGSVAMVLADLPYGSTRCAWDSPIDLPALWVELRRVCTGPVVLFAQPPFDKVLGASNLPMLRYEWIWEKTNATGHLNANRAPMKAHENVLVFYDRQPTYNPQMTTGHARKTSKGAGHSKIYGKQNAAARNYDSTERYPRDVLKFASDKQRSNLHPAQKPVALCEYLVRTYTHAGEAVLDCCMGVGSTGLAALNSGRRFIGMELDADFYALAAGRVRALPGGAV